MSMGPRTRIPSRITRRDIDNEHRVSSPLELLFDLTFVVAVAQIAAQLAHTIAAIKDAAAKRTLGVVVAAASMLLVSLGASGYGVPGTITLVVLVTSALTATSIVDTVRRPARGAPR